MCDLSASLNATSYSTSWECTDGLPTTALCNGSTSSWMGVTCVDGVVTEIDFHNSALSGSISSSIGYLTSLTYFSLGTNNLVGSIPSSFGYLVSLLRLNLGTNWLTGTIPSQMGSLTNLLDLYLDTNMLTGTVPSSLCDISSLSNLGIHDTSLTCYASCLSSVSGKSYGTVTSCTQFPTSGK